MFIFNEANVCTLETDLIEMLALPENFVVSNMFYKPNSNEVLCVVRRLAIDGESFQTMDEYTVAIESGSADGLFSIQDAVCDGWRGDFSQHIATFKPGYELQLVEQEHGIS